MKATYLRCGILAAVFAALGAASASAIEDFSTHPVFSKFLGEWKGTGDLESHSDGSLIPVTEEWQGVIEGESLVMKGTRRLGESEQEFSWTFTWNPVQEMLEGRYYSKDMENEFDFLVSVFVSEVDQSVTISGEFNGQGDTLMTIVNTFDSDKQITGSVKLENDSGDTTISGEIVHTSVE